MLQQCIAAFFGHVGVSVVQGYTDLIDNIAMKLQVGAHEMEQRTG
jgi:hypothetical protein